jgi:aminoglycoside phosphotransferase (APT) family kinase protein
MTGSLPLSDLPLGTPPPERSIDRYLVQQLLSEQFPHLSHLPIQDVDAGWDNSMFRLGENLAVRLPRRQLAAKLIGHEQTWLPRLAPRLPLPLPTPLHVGQPSLNYPWRWSIVPWLLGQSADLSEPDNTQIIPFISFLNALHIAAPIDAPINPYRGVPLIQRATVVDPRMARLGTKTPLITTEIKRSWQRALTAPIDRPATWIHGDLHARNILVEDGEISGIIDWGDMTSGDLATDLAAIWMLFEDPADRQLALATYGDLSEATIHRSIGWAILFGVVLLDTGLVDNPRHAVMGERTLRRVAVDGLAGL